jgi:hypothetical protein
MTSFDQTQSLDIMRAVCRGAPCRVNPLPQESIPVICMPQLTDTRSEMTFRPVPQGLVNGRVDFVER